MDEVTPRVDHQRSFVRLCCAFVFDPGRMEELVAEADSAVWRADTAELPVWERLNHWSLLPSAQRYLTVPRDTAAPAALWRLTSQYGNSRKGLGTGQFWLAHLGRGASCVVSVRGVELALFGTGVGFVVLEYQLRSGSQHQMAGGVVQRDRPEAWIDFAKFSRRLTQDRLRRFWEPDGDPHFVYDDVAKLLATIGLEATMERRPVTGTTAIVLAQPVPFTGLFLIGATEEQAREYVVQLRYNVGSANLETSAPEELALDDVGVRRRTSGSWFYGSTVAAGFVAVDLGATGYWQSFPGELRRQYQFALLVVLQQRHALLQLNEQIAEYWDGDDELRVVRFTELQESLHYLSAKLMPPQYSERNSQQRFYATMRRAFQVEQLNTDVRRTISELSETLRLRLADQQGQQQARFERVVSAFALTFGVPSLALAFLSVDVTGISKPLPLLVALAVVSVSIGFGALIGYAARRRRRSRSR